ncbi:MAG: hypothetical protein ACI4GD_05185 [Lachnospiraceae bacterium]
MKRKFCFIVMLTTMILSAIGCGKQDSDNNPSIIEETQSKEAEIETSEVNEKSYKLDVSETGYDAIYNLTDEYNFIIEDDIIKVINFDGDVMLEIPDCVHIDVVNGIKMYNNSFVIFKAPIKEDGVEQFDLYDAELNIIFTNKDYSEYEFVSYFEDVVLLHGMVPDKSGITIEGLIDGYLYINLKTNDVIELDTNSLGNFASYYSAFRNDVAYVYPMYNTYREIDGQKATPIGVKKNGNSYDVIYEKEYSANGIYPTLWPNCNIGSDGWLFVTMKNTSDGSESDGFYNIFQNKFVEFDYNSIDGHIRYKWFKDGGIGKCVSVNGVAHIISSSGGSEYIQAYDIEEKKWLGDYLYIQSDACPEDRYLLVQTMDGLWGYVDRSYNLVGELYEDASAFSNGIAIIKKNDGLYMIDEKFEIISDVIDGDYSAYVGNGFFTIYKGDLVYPAKLVVE